jgi:hypothetical protein
MKIFVYFLLILTVVFCLCGVNYTFACGTIKGWVDTFLLEGRYEALCMIHCWPIVLEQYKKTKEEHELLAKMINRALEDPRDCIKLLAIKNFFIFDKLEQIKETQEYLTLISKIEKILGRPISKIRIRKGELSLFNEWCDCNIVAGEIKRLMSSSDQYKGKEEVRELILTPEQMERYAAYYKDLYVLHIRKAIKNYLRGKLEGYHYGSMKLVDQEYLENKFIILSIEKYPSGGRSISLISQKKPDKIFWVWVHGKEDGPYELRAFEVDEFTNEEIEDIKIKFRQYLQNKDLAL